MSNLGICYYSRKNLLRDTTLTRFHLPEIISGLYEDCVCSFSLYWKLCFPLRCMYLIFLFFCKGPAQSLQGDSHSLLVHSHCNPPNHTDSWTRGSVTEGLPSLSTYFSNGFWQAR